MMKEIVGKTKEMNSVNTLVRDFRALGLQKGMTILVHSSLSSLGWVNGGAMAVIEALIQVITEEGTIVMPAQSGDWNEPSKWGNPPVPESWWEEIRQTMPAFDKDKTPTSGMGLIPEVFRKYPNVDRSDHPSASFVAWGKNRNYIISNHSIDFSLGEQSPLARLYDLDAQVLFIGTGYFTNTAFHLGEYRAPGAEIVKEGASIIENGQPVWRVYNDIEFAVGEFEEIGAILDREYDVTKGLIGLAESRLFSIREAVDCAEKYFIQKRAK